MKTFAELVKEAMPSNAPFVPSRAMVEDAIYQRVVLPMLAMPYAEMKAWVMQTYRFDAGPQVLAIRLYKQHAGQ
jgi:hypothetical protein